LLVAGKTTVLLHVRDWGLILFVAFGLQEVVWLFLLVLGWNHLSLLFLPHGLRCSGVFIFKITHFKGLNHVLFRFFHLDFLYLWFYDGIRPRTFLVKNVIFAIALVITNTTLRALLIFAGIADLNRIIGQLQRILTYVFKVLNSRQRIQI
jgi:hypothetical protein